MFTTRPSTCNGCHLHDHSLCTGFQPAPDGKGLIPLAIVAEALGENEAKDSLPLRPYAESGSLFERALRSIGIQREQLIVTNLVKCRPPGNRLVGESYEHDAVNHCRQYLDAEVARFKPRAILTLGAVPFKHLTGFTGRGKQALEYTRGYPVESIWYPGIPVIGTYHPAHVRRGATELFPVIVHDLHKALQIARGRVKYPDDTPLNYQLGGAAALQQLLSILRRDPTRKFAYDLETKDSSAEDEDKYDGLSLDTPITLVQFSIAPGSGLAVRWDATTIPLIHELFALPNPKSAHNGWQFDDKQLAAKGIVINGPTRDTMAMWHHLQPDLPANLSFVASFYGMPTPWKHLASQDFIQYGCADVDAVMRIEQRIEQDLAGLRFQDPKTGERGISLWEGFQETVAPLRPVLLSMEHRGIPRDPVATQKLVEYCEREKTRLWGEIQATAPTQVKPIQRWVDWPEDCRPIVKAWAESHLVTPISARTGKALKEKVPIVKIINAYHMYAIDPEHIIYNQVVLKDYRFDDKGGLFKTLPFLPNSTEHLKSYLRYYKIKVPLNLDDDETTGRTELDKLMKRLKQIKESTLMSKVLPSTWGATFTVKPTRDSFDSLRETAGVVYGFLESVLTYRKLHKADGTYVSAKDWQPNSHTGRIHSTFTLSATATLQLSSRKPNVQNIPKGKNPRDVVGTMLGKMLRETVKADPGHVILELDYSGCHLVTMGLEAEDPQYIRLARIDGHSFLAANMVAVELKQQAPRELLDLAEWLSFSDEQLAAKLAWVKKNFKGLRNDKAKPALLGNQLGLGSRKLYSINDDSFANENEAKRVQAILSKLFPKIPLYQQFIREVAQRQGYLISRYGSIRRFSDVQRYSSKTGGLVAGMDAEKAGAYHVQVNAQGKLREAMIELENEGWNERCGLINQVHDSLVYHMPIGLLEEAVPAIAAIMERPARHLKHSTICPEGLVLNVEAAVGLDWGNLVEVRIVNGKVAEWPDNIKELISK
jgi:uracil-DNA glycosylase family 4